MCAGISIGASVEAVDAARKAVLEIIEKGRDRETTVEALKLFGAICEVKSAHIEGNTIYMTSPTKAKPKAKKS